METCFCNAQVLYERVKKVIDQVAEEKPFGELSMGDVEAALGEILYQLHVEDEI